MSLRVVKMINKQKKIIKNLAKRHTQLNEAKAL